MADDKQDGDNGPSSSRVVLAKPKLGGFASSTLDSNKTNNKPGSIFRPPQLKTGFGNNPFLRIETATKENEAGVSQPSEPKESSREAEVPKFVPLGSANIASRSNSFVPTPKPIAVPESGFVFGQNLSERVLMNEAVNNGATSSTSEHSSTNGTPTLLFTSAAAATVKENNQPKSSEDTVEGLAAAAAEYERSHARPPPPSETECMTGEEGEINVLQISPITRECKVSEQRSLKRKRQTFADTQMEFMNFCLAMLKEKANINEFEALGINLAKKLERMSSMQAIYAETLIHNVLRMGILNELNANMDISCRLFAWEDGSWRERGRGMLRLNDAVGDAGASRLVARVSGSLRVVLNTNLWPDMVLERAGSKSLRISAMDAQHQIKLFLIMATPSDIAMLHRSMMSRVAVSKRNLNSISQPSQEAAEKLDSSTNDNEHFNDNHRQGDKHEKDTEESDRLDSIVDNSTDDKMQTDNSNTTDNQTLKRKETDHEDGKSPKRQCPQILIDG